MSSFEQNSLALQNELQSLHHVVHQDKDKLERVKQEQKSQQMQMTAMLESCQTNQQELLKHQKIHEKYSHIMAQYMAQIPQEAQIQLSNEFEKVKQALTSPADPHQQLTQNMMAGNLAAMGGMGGLPAMMALQAQAQAQLGRGMMPGLPAPSPRVQKTNGLPNGMPVMPPGMPNGLSAQMAAMQNPMLAAAAAAGMPAGMAQLQAMAAFSNMQAMGAMPGFNPAQLAAMQALILQSMGMNGMMLPPMSAANPALAAQAMMNPMSLAVSTPSRNPSNNGPLSGTRTPQSAPSNGVNSPRTIVKEEPVESKKDDIVPTEDTVAVA